MKRTADQPAAAVQESEAGNTGEQSPTLLVTILQELAALKRLLKGNANQNADALDTKKELSSYLKCSLRQVENLAKAGKIPPPIYISDSSPRWRRSDVVAWLDKLARENSEVRQ